MCGMIRVCRICACVYVWNKVYMSEKIPGITCMCVLVDECLSKLMTDLNIDGKLEYIPKYMI